MANNNNIAVNLVSNNIKDILTYISVVKDIEVGTNYSGYSDTGKRDLVKFYQKQLMNSMLNIINNKAPSQDEFLALEDVFRKYPNYLNSSFLNRRVDVTETHGERGGIGLMRLCEFFSFVVDDSIDSVSKQKQLEAFDWKLLGCMNSNGVATMEKYIAALAKRQAVSVF